MSWVPGERGFDKNRMTWAPGEVEAEDYKKLISESSLNRLKDARADSWVAGERTSLTHSSFRLRNTLRGFKLSKWLAKKFSWYGEHASLHEAWAYFEHIRLPRRMEEPGGSGFTLAPPGTTDSSLYPACTTEQKELNDFGTGAFNNHNGILLLFSLETHLLSCFSTVGIAVYFETLRLLTKVCLVAGLLYTPTLLYFLSGAYADQSDRKVSRFLLRASLVCTTRDWVPCPTCTAAEWTNDHSRFATSGNLVFALKNECAHLGWYVGANHLVVIFFLMFCVVGFTRYQIRRELEYDESILTASDYSIQVDNPPPDATDPDGTSCLLLSIRFCFWLCQTSDTD